MGKPTGFKEYGRQPPPKRPVALRMQDYDEFVSSWSEEDARAQGARCMNCAVPFCHSGCPLGNLIPDWNDLVYRGEWEAALAALHRTNNFPSSLAGYARRRARRRACCPSTRTRSPSSTSRRR